MSLLRGPVGIRTSCEQSWEALTGVENHHFHPHDSTKPPAAATQPDQASTLSDLPQVLQPKRIFVVDVPLQVATADNQDCSLTGGDVLRLVARPDDNAVTADLIVVSGKLADCPAGARVIVALPDLQEMQNNFRAQLDAGLRQLHDERHFFRFPGFTV